MASRKLQETRVDQARALEERPVARALGGRLAGGFETSSELLGKSMNQPGQKAG